MENIYNFMLKYLDAMLLAEKNGFHINEQYHKALEFYDDIALRANETHLTKKDALYKSCFKVYNSFRILDHENLYQAVLQHWGITEEPYKVFYTNKQTIPSKKYVLAFFIDYNGEEERARNGGNGERYYGNGKSTTRKEFWKEIQSQYKNCEWTEVCRISDVYDEPETILYEFNGFLYREFVK